MNWNNIDLNSQYERQQDILTGYNCETILLEVHCNVRNISREAVREQAMISLESRYNEAIEILNANLDNLTAEAIRQRAIE